LSGADINSELPLRIRRDIDVGFVEGFARAARFYRQNRLPTLTTLRAPCVPHNLLCRTNNHCDWLQCRSRKEAVRHFTRLGASKIILAVRNSKAGEEAKKDIESSTKCGTDVLEVWTPDLLSYESCKSFADRASKLPRLDVLLGECRYCGIEVVTCRGP
jgi:hypothetical protein